MFRFIGIFFELVAFLNSRIRMTRNGYDEFTNGQTDRAGGDGF